LEINMQDEPQVVVINATVYPWQRQALETYQQRIGVRTLSEALRSVLSQVLPKPEETEQPA